VSHRHWHRGAEPIIADCKAAGRVAIIDRNTRRQPALKAEIAAERTACRTINVPHSDDLIYNERTAVERTNGAVKDDYGGPAVLIATESRSLRLR
jgi:hypothetical protein